MIDFLRFPGILKRWIAEYWMVFAVISGEHYFFSYVEAKYSAVSVGAILYKENCLSCFHVLDCKHGVDQNCCRTSPEALGNWNDYHSRLISYSVSLFP